MSLAMAFFIGLGAFTFGVLAAALYFLRKQQAGIAEIASLRTQLAESARAGEEKLTLLQDARKQLTDAFNSLSSDALRANNQSFLDLAKTTLEKFQETAKGDLEKRQNAISEIVKPVKDSLEKVDSKIAEMEKARPDAYGSLTAQVRSLLETQTQLRSETSNLVKALRSPIVRGRWGEIQLRRVVEMAGMLDHCDFEEQESVTTADGRLRPDLIVRLPGGKNIVVDAKAPLSAYLEAIECGDDATRKERLLAHARQIRAHIEALTRKSYWEQFQPAPEFVVLFLPGETFFSAALEHDPALIEFGADKRVILATPTTLIALLRAVFYGWRQQSLAENAKEISDLGRDLYKRLSDMGGHFDKLGRSLNNSVEAYNKAVGSMESRVLVTARKLKDLKSADPGVELAPLEPLDQVSRQLQAPELVAPNGEEPAPVLNAPE